MVTSRHRLESGRVLPQVALWVMAACGGDSNNRGALPPVGVHGIVGPVDGEGAPGAAGQLRIERSTFGGDAVFVDVVGPLWRTPGEVVAVVSHGELGGAPATWLTFALRTGVGEAQAVMRVQGQELRLPLGGRPTEHELVFSFSDEGPAARAALATAREPALRAAEAGWAQGGLRLIDPSVGEGGLVGELVLRGELDPAVAVYDDQWLTPDDGPVLAGRTDEGGDLVVTFPVEPSLDGESAMLRINIATQTAVVPLGPVPEPAERRLQVQFGEVTPEERQQARRRARAAADAAEVAWLRDVMSRLAQIPPGPTCARSAQLEGPWALMLAGYEVNESRMDGECQLWLAPEVIQHRRRHRASVLADGTVSIEGPAAD